MESLRKGVVRLVLGLAPACLMTTGCETPVARPEAPQSAAVQQEDPPPEGSFSSGLRPVRTDDSLFLFNGSNLDGWSMVGSAQDWSVAEGVLRSPGSRDVGWLRFDGPLDDFILKLDWKVSGNSASAVFIRSAQAGDPGETGHRIPISPHASRDRHLTCSLSGKVAPDQKPTVSADTWHTLEIRAQGPGISVASDGVGCLDVDQTDLASLGAKPLQGHIGLQSAQGGEGSFIEFRDIQLRFLEPGS